MNNKKELKDTHYAHDGLLPTAVDHVGDEEMTLDYAMADEKVRNNHLTMLLKASDDLFKKLNVHIATQATVDFDALTES
jgi:hypothetical protein